MEKIKFNLVMEKYSIQKCTVLFNTLYFGVPRDPVAKYTLTFTEDEAIFESQTTGYLGNYVMKDSLKLIKLLIEFFHPPGK
jgi:hypothetical protein